MKNKVLFCLPTVFTNPDRTNRCVDHLLFQCELNNIDFKIFVVSNIEDDKFENWIPKDSRVIKMVSGQIHNVSKALNLAINKITDEDYFVQLQDDMFILDNKWIDNFIQIYNVSELKCGVLGIRPHTTRNTYCLPVENKYNYKMEELLWSDGVMFMSTNIFSRVGKFEEVFVGDKESQDFCYKVHESGLRNYMVYINRRHESSGHGAKFSGEKQKFYIKCVVESKKMFFKKWFKCDISDTETSVKWHKQKMELAKKRVDE